jgi:hypothetical protein
MSSDGLMKIVKLRRGGNYRQWASSVKALLITLDLDEWLVMQPDHEKRSEVRSDMKAKARIQMFLEGALQYRVEEASSAMEAWQLVYDDYVGSLAARRSEVVSKVKNLQQAAKESIDDYIDRCHDIFKQLEDINFESRNEILCDSFIEGLQPTLRTAVVPAISESKMMNFEMISADVKALARRLKIDHRDRGSLMTTSGRDTRRCEHCGKTGHQKAKCWSLHPEKRPSGVKTRKRCDHCGKPGHTKAECFQLHPERRPKHDQACCGIVCLARLVLVF